MPQPSHRRAAPLVLLLALGAAPVPAADWPQWRGPAGSGAAAGVGFPAAWSPEKNLLWKAVLPGPGSSTPAVWGDHVLLTCAIEGRNAVVCLGRDGRERWRRTLGAAKPGKNQKASGANPSPVTDGTHVWAYFKSGELACLAVADGTVAWSTNLQERFGEDTLWWDLGTSPVLTEKGVVVAVMQSGPSYLAAFGRGDGALLWKHDRLLDAPEESAQSYTTPIVAPGDAAKGEPAEVLFVLGADHVTAHDAATGRELWRVGGLNPGRERFFRSIASPVLAGDLVIAPYARGATLTAIRRGGSGDVTASHVAWTRKDVGSDVPTPVVDGGRLWVCNDKGHVACLDVASGAPRWQGDLPKHRLAYSSSPVLVEGRVVFIREDGHATILRAGDALEILGTGEVDGALTVATPVCVDGRVLVRTLDALWCFAVRPPG